MGLRNAFDNLGTESALRRIANLLTFARDGQDRIRTVVDNTVATTTSVFNRGTSTAVTNSTSGALYSNYSWSDRDGREEIMLQYKQRADFVKKSRWTY